MKTDCRKILSGLVAAALAAAPAIVRADRSYDRAMSLYQKEQALRDSLFAPENPARLVAPPYPAKEVSTPMPPLNPQPQPANVNPPQSPPEQQFANRSSNPVQPPRSLQEQHQENYSPAREEDEAPLVIDQNGAVKVKVPTSGVNRRTSNFFTRQVQSVRRFVGF